MFISVKIHLQQWCMPVLISCLYRVYVIFISCLCHVYIMFISCVYVMLISCLCHVYIER